MEPVRTVPINPSSQISERRTQSVKSNSGVGAPRDARDVRNAPPPGMCVTSIAQRSYPTDSGRWPCSAMPLILTSTEGRTAKVHFGDEEDRVLCRHPADRKRWLSLVLCGQLGELVR